MRSCEEAAERFERIRVRSWGQGVNRRGEQEEDGG